MKKRLSVFSISVSLLIHALFLAFVQTHSLWFCSPVAAAHYAPQRVIGTIRQDQILKETFVAPYVPEKAIQPKQQRVTSMLAYSPLKEVPQVAITFNQKNLPSPLLPTEPLWTHPIVLLQCQIPNFLEGLILPPLDPIETRVFEKQRLLTPQSESVVLQAPAQQALSDAPMNPLALLSSLEEQRKVPIMPQEQETYPVGTIPSIPLPELPPFLSLAKLDTINLSDAFNAELTFLPKPEGSGYLFALTLVPREDLQFPKMKQRLTFLIDRGNSIQRERLQASKQAVLRALEELDGEDAFNILTFDSKVDKLFPSFAFATPSAIAKAEEFLDKLDLGSFFATSDPYRPLLHTIPGQVGEEEVHTAILLTDGETLSSKNLRHSLLNDWTLQNQGKVSLYVVGMETDPNATAFEKLCLLNRGKYIPASSQRGLKRQILKLAKNIKTPLAKDLSSKIICRSTNHRTEIYPQAALSPHLYLDQPYVIMGSTDTLDDFILFIQGRLKNQWLNIKKNLSFVHAKKGHHSLKTAFYQYEKLDPKIVQ